MQRGIYFDQDRCTGCFACSVACKDLHDTPAGPVQQDVFFSMPVTITDDINPMGVVYQGEPVPVGENGN